MHPLSAGGQQGGREKSFKTQNGKDPKAASLDVSAEGGRASSKCLALGSSQPPLWAMERDSQAKCNQRQVLNLWGRKRKHQMSSVTWKTKIQSWEPTTRIITTPFQDMTMKSPPSFLLPSPSIPALSHSSPALPPHNNKMVLKYYKWEKQQQWLKSVNNIWKAENKWTSGPCLSTAEKA